MAYKDGFALKASFGHPMGLAFDKLGDMLIADTGNNRIRRITSPVKSCEDKNECTNEKCNALTGNCDYDKVTNGSPCKGDKPCITGQVCSSGLCVSGAPKSCDDGNSCSWDSCEAATGKCVYKTSFGCKKVRRVFLTWAALSAPTRSARRWPM
jgi:hypothetical protein